MANLANLCNSEKSVKLFRIWWTRGDSNPGLLVANEEKSKLRLGATVT
jgi:hypothetical protein